MIHFCLVLVAFFCLSLPANAALIDNGDGTVTDTSTGLMWQKYPSDLLTKSGADRFIEELNWGQYSDWHYPTYQELETFLPLFEIFWVHSGCIDFEHCILMSYSYCEKGQIRAVRNTILDPPIYNQKQLDQTILQERSRWDADGDNKIGLPEAIRALQIISGMR